MLSSGGVCAVLDYELDQMTDYIAEMAQRITQPGRLASPAFRKFVSGLLSSTRLPRTTILLGMNLLARRANHINNGSAAGEVKFTDGTVWRMLTIALLLGSKFLDDNTFQNRSWSEVSGIQVRELNTLEIEWLESMNWNLYVNLDESTDYNAWLNNWEDWRRERNIERSATIDRLTAPPLAPINTNVTRPNPYAPAQVQPQPQFAKAPAVRAHAGYHQSAYDGHSWNPYATPPHLTPPSAPDSAIHTPEYLSATGGVPGHQWQDWSVYQPHPAYFYPTPSQMQSYRPPRITTQHTPYSANSYQISPGYQHYDKCPSPGCGGMCSGNKMAHIDAYGGSWHNQIQWSVPLQVA